MYFKSTYLVATLVVLGASGSFFMYQLYRNQHDLYLLVQQRAVEQQQLPLKKEIVERVVRQVEPWSDLQAQIKDCVVQVFVQAAALDLLQPYKSPSQYQATGSGFFINENGEIIT